MYEKAPVLTDIKLSGYWSPPVLDSMEEAFRQRAQFNTEHVIGKREALSVADLTGIISAATAVVTLCLYLIDRRCKDDSTGDTPAPTLEEIKTELKTQGILQSEITEVYIECQAPLQMTVRVARSFSRIEHSYRITQQAESFDISPVE